MLYVRFEASNSITRSFPRLFQQRNEEGERPRAPDEAVDGKIRIPTRPIRVSVVYIVEANALSKPCLENSQAKTCRHQLTSLTTSKLCSVLSEATFLTLVAVMYVVSLPACATLS